MNRRALLVTLTVMAGLCSQRGRNAAAELEPEVRLLWIGGSLTYTHDLPLQAANWAGKATGKECRSELVGAADPIHAYLQPGYARLEYGALRGESIQARIQRAKASLVILEADPQLAEGRDAEAYLAGLEAYCRLIREAGGEAVYYEATVDRDGEMGRDRLAASAKKNGVRRYAPVGRGVRLLRAAADSADTTLPERYLTLCCLQAALTGKLPQSVTGAGAPTRSLRVWRPVPDEVRGELDARLRANPPEDPYVLSLPIPLQVRSEAASLELIEEDAARRALEAATKVQLAL